MTTRQRKRGALTAEDRRLWTSIARTTTPLPGTIPVGDGPDEGSLSDLIGSPVSRETVTSPQAISPQAAPPFPAPGASLSIPDDFRVGRDGAFRDGTAPSPRPGVRQLPALHHGHSPGVDRRTAQRFKRGRMDIDARIDLHGMGQELAHVALIRFIESSAAAGCRCVLVITGQGERGQGVLKRTVPRWLNDDRLRPHVLSFSQAQVEHGGHGALYVLLRRQRG